MLTGVEVILAALAAGAAAGSTEAAKPAVIDAYSGLRALLRRRLDDQSIDAGESQPEVWQVRVGAALTGAGLDQDAGILAAAQRLLALIDADRARGAAPAVDLRGASDVQVGDGTVRAGTVHGVAAGTVTGAVHLTFGETPIPPVAPGA